MYQLNCQINWNEEDKDGFEILEINNTDHSQFGESDVNFPKTPVKYSQSDGKVNKIHRYINLNNK